MQGRSRGTKSNRVLITVALDWRQLMMRAGGNLINAGRLFLSHSIDANTQHFLRNRWRFA